MKFKQQEIKEYKQLELIIQYSENKFWVIGKVKCKLSSKKYFDWKWNCCECEQEKF